MRKIFLFAPFILAALFSCQKESLISEETITDEGALTAYAPEESKVSVDGLNVTWCAGEELAVVGKTDKNINSIKYYHLDSGAGTKTAVFKPNGDPCMDANVFAITKKHTKKDGDNHYFFEIPTTQTYVGGKVEDNLLPLFCFSSRDALQFRHLAAVVKVSFWSKEAKQIKSVVFENDNIIGGFFYFDPVLTWGTYKGAISSNSNTIISLNCDGCSLSTSEGSPTDFYFVIGTASGFSGTLSNLKFTVYTTDGQVCTFAKTSPVKYNAGDQIVFSAPRECVFSESSIKIKIDDNDWTPWPMGGIVATNSIKVKTGNEKMTETQFDEILSACAAAASPLELDFSEANWQKTSLGSAFCKNNTKIKSFVFPRNLQRFYNECFRNSKVQRLSIPSCVQSIGAAFGMECGDVEFTTYDVPGKPAKYGVVDGLLCKLNTKGEPDILQEIVNRKSVTSLKLPDSITTIENFVFDGCTNLRSIVFSASLAKVESSAYLMKLLNLESIRFKGNVVPTFPTSVGSMGKYATTRKVYVNDLNDWEDSNVYKALYTNATYKYTFEEWDDALSAGIPDLK